MKRFSLLACIVMPGPTVIRVIKIGRFLSWISYYLSSYVFKNLYIELEKQVQSDSCKKRKRVSREVYTFLEVKLRRLWRKTKTYEDK